jgi:bacterioferritin-associated ferredoxin
MIVCICARVSDRQIRQAAADGAHSLECLQIDLGVATRCGNCADCAIKVLGEAHSDVSSAGGAAVRQQVLHCQQRRAA